MSHHASNAAGTHAEVTKHADTVGHRTQKSFKTDRRDRWKHSGKLGANAGPKKGGAGGKTTWGRPGDEAKGELTLSRDDPNYASDEDLERVGGGGGGFGHWEPEQSFALKFASSLEDLARFKREAKEAAAEFVESGDVEECMRIIRALGMSVYHQELAPILIKYSFDLNVDQRARISSLLHSLYKNGLITPTQMASGVRKLYNQLSELCIDYPQAKTWLREHVQFASAGGFLDPNLCAQLEKEAEALSDEAKVKELKEKTRKIIIDYFQSEDVADAVKSLQELNAPYLAFETVKQLLLLALDRGNRQREGASVFLARATSSELGSYLTTADIERGFTQLLERTEDHVADVPNLLKFLSIFLARAVVDEVLPPSFLVRVDLNTNDLGSRVLQRAQQLTKQENASEKLEYAWEDLDEEEYQKQQKSQERVSPSQEKEP